MKELQQEVSDWLEKNNKGDLQGCTFEELAALGKSLGKSMPVIEYALSDR